MNIKDFMANTNEKPLDKIVTNGGFTGIFRKITCIGDSLSSGEFESFENGSRNWHDYYDYSWGQYMARDAGCTVYNFSKGGMSAKCYFDFAREKGFFDDKYKSQAYIIALGVNDITQVIDGETEFGDISDIDLENHSRNKPTFVGYYAKIISVYKAIEPRAKFFLMTLPNDNADGKRKELYDKHREILYKLSEMFSNCYVLDFRKYAPPYDEDFRKNFYLSNHLNACGYRLTALMVESYIDYIIRNNPRDFAKIGFVGTPFDNVEDI